MVSVSVCGGPHHVLLTSHFEPGFGWGLQEDECGHAAGLKKPDERDGEDQFTHSGFECRAAECTTFSRDRD